jgi:hypothetical protein
VKAPEPPKVETPPPPPTPVAQDAATVVEKPTEPPPPPVEEKPAPVAVEAPKPPPVEEKPAPPPPAEEKPAPPPPEPAKPPASIKSELPAPAPATDGVRGEVAALIAAGKDRIAEQRLRAELVMNRDAAWAHFELGHIYFTRLWRKDCIKEWDEALRADPSLRNDARLAERICMTLGPKWDGQGAQLAQSHLGDRVAPVMNACIGTMDDFPRVLTAIRVIERGPGAKHVDRGLVALRTLELAPGCPERVAAIRTIVQKREKRAMDALTKLQNDTCVGKPATEALQRLK